MNIMASVRRVCRTHLAGRRPAPFTRPDVNDLAPTPSTPIGHDRMTVRRIAMTSEDSAPRPETDVDAARQLERMSRGVAAALRLVGPPESVPERDQRKS
jgi:hypothetical protein